MVPSARAWVVGAAAPAWAAVPDPDAVPGVARAVVPEPAAELEQVLVRVLARVLAPVPAAAPGVEPEQVAVWVPVVALGAELEWAAVLERAAAPVRVAELARAVVPEPVVAQAPAAAPVQDAVRERVVVPARDAAQDWDAGWGWGAGPGWVRDPEYFHVPSKISLQLPTLRVFRVCTPAAMLQPNFDSSRCHPRGHCSKPR